MILLDFEIAGDRPSVPIARSRAVEALEVEIEIDTETQEHARSARGRGRALGAMRVQWYAAIWRVGAVLASKELLDFDDGNELPLFIAGPSLIETQAQDRPIRF